MYWTDITTACSPQPLTLIQPYPLHLSITLHLSNIYPLNRDKNIYEHRNKAELQHKPSFCLKAAANLGLSLFISPAQLSRLINDGSISKVTVSAPTSISNIHLSPTSIYLPQLSPTYYYRPLSTEFFHESKERVLLQRKFSRGFWVDSEQASTPATPGECTQHSYICYLPIYISLYITYYYRPLEVLKEGTWEQGFW